MILDFEPGDKVFCPKNKDWGIGQVQSIIKDKITVNFQNSGKQVIAEQTNQINDFINTLSLIFNPKPTLK